MKNQTRLVAFALAATAAACSDITYTDPVALQGRIISRTEDGVFGQAAAVSQFRNTEAGIDVTGASLTTYGWQINHGTCAQPGSILGGRGNYPDVTTTDRGTGQIQRTFVSEILRGDEEYHAVIVDAATRQRVLACGDLSEVTP